LSDFIELVESQPRVLRLNEPQLAELVRLGNDLAGSSSWWGENEVAPPRSVVSIEARGGGAFSVRVHNAVGAIGLPGLTLVVRPKIDVSHFAYIARFALIDDFRRDESQAWLGEGIEFSEVVATWFLQATEVLIQRGLERDYAMVVDRSSVVRGKVDLTKTVMGWLSGSSLVEAAYDEFEVDTPLNRLLRSATRAVSATAWFSAETRSRADRLTRRMVGVGGLQRGDLEAKPRRGQVRYGPALELARQVLVATGRELSDGRLRSQSFLVSTPRLIETGIRVMLKRGLSPTYVGRHSRALKPSSLTVNPDFEVGPPPYTGDIKYKVGRVAWNRPDLAQAVFFAAAYRAPLGLIVGFRDSQSAPAKELQVGDIHIGYASWNVSAATPEAAEREMVDQVRCHLDRALTSLS